MRSFTRLMLGVVLLTLVTPLKAETVMYCSTELATGFIKDNGSWRTTSFKKKRYTIKFNRDFTKLSGLLESGTFDCKENSLSPNVIVCSSFLDGSTFMLDRITERFTYFSAGLFAYVQDQPDTDNLNAGTCTKF